MRRTLAVHTLLTLFLLVLIVFAAGCGGGGSVESTPPPQNPPTISSPFSFSAVAGNNSVTLSWSPVTGATSYNLYRSLSSPVTKTTGTKIAANTNGTGYSDTIVTTGTRYYYVMTSILSGIESAESSEVSAIPGSTGTISGQIKYEDKELGPSPTGTGFTGNTTLKAVRYAAVDIVDAANSSVLKTTQTDSLGRYSVTVSAGTTTVYVRVNTEALPPSSASAITVASLANGKYGVPGQNFTLSGSADVNIVIPTTNLAGGAFNILDVMTTGYDFVHYLNGAYPSIPLSAFWEPGNTQYGTYFCTGGCPPNGLDGIYIFSQTGGDTDEYDDDVLWHEFGHFVAFNYSLDVSPGGVHYLGDSGYDLRLAWSEGWGDFFPGAVKTWLFATNPGLLSVKPGMTLTTYVDTSGSGGFSFDFGNPPFTFSKDSSNEVAVAKVLTDLQNSSFSTIHDVWDVFIGIKSILPPATDPVNLETFWDMWLSLKTPNPATLAQLNTVYSSRAIRYTPDTWEPNDTVAFASTFTINQSQTHTIYPFTYPGEDKDYYKFTVVSGKQYTISTTSLQNGCDTSMTILASDGTTTITANDNIGNVSYTAPFNCATDVNGNFVCHENGNDLLASSVVLSSAMSGTYYVEITSSASRPRSAGKYGSYTLTITSP
jgi:fibronectin type 3 domain-containing protein